jgi:rod shape-determining protein MreC
VKSVDPTMSIAIAWAHPDFRVSAMAADGGAFGIVGAHLGNEPERYLLEMRGVPMRSNLVPGSLIVSSGLGGTFPRGIPVGTVIAEMKTSEPWARTYLLRPAVAPADVTDVMVLLPARTTAGVPNVWKVGLHADSAVKSIVAAGDSLAKLHARRDSAAAPRDTTPRRDSARVVSTARRDTTRRDTVRAATTVRRDTVRRDTARSVTGVKVVPSAQSEVRPSRVPPAAPSPTTTTP